MHAAFTPPSRTMTSDEIAVMAQARFSMLERLQPSRSCTCGALDVRVFVCAFHWRVEHVELRHEAGCVIAN